MAVWLIRPQALFDVGIVGFVGLLGEILDLELGSMAPSRFRYWLDDRRNHIVYEFHNTRTTS